MDLNWNINEQVPEGYRIYATNKRVKGISFRQPEIRKALNKASWLEPQRESHNKHDPNAIKILAGWKRLFGISYAHIGYIDKTTARRIVENDDFDNIKLAKQHVWYVDGECMMFEYALLKRE